ncbi:MAG: DUF2075 domain-containing protein [Leptolyngbya sp. SIO4C5]|nr:DUF2075 domain-containing protein [Leptolyngbya sp. SIO4C5]
MTEQLGLFSPETVPAWGWSGTVSDFLQLEITAWLQALGRSYQTLYQQQATQTQQQAWADSGEIMQAQLSQVVAQRPAAAGWTLVFEYELPREGGRRPDLVILAAGQILVVEFKQKTAAIAADLDQVAAYVRDLAEYHSHSRQHPLTPILVPTRQTETLSRQVESVQVLSPSAIAEYLVGLETRSPAVDPQAWLTAEYQPLPSVVQAAQQIFQHEPLPNIRRARSARIPELLDYLNQLVQQAQAQQERHLVLITGVPGAGKTLVGLQFVYQNPLQSDQDKTAVLLSGNAPLIQVLQYALKSRVFVQGIRNFYLQHQVRRQTAPPEHIIVFDEAQRAWDAERMSEKYGIEAAAASAVLTIAERIPDWCVVLGLIGEGQEIHVGEEEGTEQWNVALEQAQQDWQVHCSSQQADYFEALSSNQLYTDDLFNLSTSLRSHLAKDVQTWAAHLLSGNLTAAAALMPAIAAAGFDAYLTRDLEVAKQYCRDRYQDQPQKRYGLMASSRARNLPDYGIRNDYLSTQRLKVGPWYIDPPDSPLSCCALERVVTEFSCQGLELDFPIIGWGDDLLWNGQAWITRTRQRNVKDPLRLRRNSYRVLLTRGRDGLVIFVPPDPKMESTYQALKESGVRSL